MRKIILFLFVFTIFTLLGTNFAFAQAISLSVTPTQILQGNPFMVIVDGVTEISSIKKLAFDGKKLEIFMYQKKPSALVPVDLNKKPGSYKLEMELPNGDIVEKNIEIEKRDKTEASLGIPKKLGGNTKASQDKLVASLNEDNKILTSLRTNKKALWIRPFTSPLKQIFVTDPYGNSRKTGEYAIPHKGTDYKAKDGTGVMTINRGVVRLTKSFRNHGKTIVVDHGMGVLSYYLHLSKFKVKVGDIVSRGQVIGLSGHSGYSTGPHLHLAIRINNIAVDPEKFLELFK